MGAGPLEGCRWIRVPDLWGPGPRVGLLLFHLLDWNNLSGMPAIPVRVYVALVKIVSQKDS